MMSLLYDVMAVRVFLYIFLKFSILLLSYSEFNTDSEYVALSVTSSTFKKYRSYLLGSKVKSDFLPIFRQNIANQNFFSLVNLSTEKCIKNKKLEKTCYSYQKNRFIHFYICDYQGSYSSSNSSMGLCLIDPTLVLKCSPQSI